MRRLSGIRKVLVLLATLVMCMNILQPVMVSAEDGWKSEMLEALAEGERLLKKMPDPTKNRVVGYSYYRTLPHNDFWWDVAYLLSKVFSGEFAELFSNLSRDRFYFSAAMLMCASEEEINWVNSNGLANALNANEDSYSEDIVDKVIELGTDDMLPYVDSEIVDMAKAFETVKFSFRTVKEFCDACNQKKLLDSLDWERVQRLSETWRYSSNYDLARIGGLLERMQNYYTGEGQSVISVMSVLKEYGLNDIVNMMVSESLKAAMGGAGFFVAAMILCTDAYTRFSALSGSYDDLRFSADIVEACWNDLKGGINCYEINKEDCIRDNDLDMLEFSYEWAMNSSINYLQACALMNNNYYEYVRILRTVQNDSIRNQSDYDRADQALMDAKAFQEQARQLRQALELFRKAMYKKENSKTPFHVTIGNLYWMSRDSDRTELVLTIDWTGKMHIELFCRRQHVFDADLTADEDGLYHFAQNDWACGTVRIVDGKLRLYMDECGVTDLYESDWAWFFDDKEYVELSPATYDEVWYEKPDNSSIPDDHDWLGHWVLKDEKHESHLDIFTYNKEYYMEISFDGSFDYYGKLEPSYANSMWMETDGFCTGLELNRKHNTILLIGIGPREQFVMDLLEDYQYLPEYKYVGQELYH